MLARWIAITGATSLRHLADIWSNPDALATSSSLKPYQLLLHLYYVEQNPHIRFESAYNTLL